MKKIGLIAGKSRYPIILAEEARKQGYFLVCAGIKGEAPPEIEKAVAEFYWLEVGELEKLINIFKGANIKQAIMAGGISKRLLFKKDLYLDKSMQEIFKTIKDNRDISILSAFARLLKKEGIELMDAASFLPDLFPEKGCLSRRSPDAQEWEDIRFGWDIAKELSRLDIGMTVVVRNKTVLALEAIEGTDEAVKRGALLGNRDCIVVKVSRPDQDARFDLPVVGFSTIETMKNSGARVLAIEARQVLFIDRDESVEEANKAGIAIVAL
jgi:DUF1009 family protein